MSDSSLSSSPPLPLSPSPAPPLSPSSPNPFEAAYERLKSEHKQKLQLTPTQSSRERPTTRSLLSPNRTLPLSLSFEVASPATPAAELRTNPRSAVESFSNVEETKESMSATGSLTTTAASRASINKEKVTSTHTESLTLVQKLFQLPWFMRIATWHYEWSLWFHICMMLLILIVCQVVDSNLLSTDRAASPALRTCLFIIIFIQLSAMGFAHIGMAKELSSIEFIQPLKVWNMYMAVQLTYCTMYFVVFCMSRKTFNLQGYMPDVEFNPNDDVTDGSSSLIDLNGGPAQLSDTTNYNDPVSVYVFFLYFSCAIITSTGFGDIVPTYWLTEVIANTQMLAGMCYHAGVFGIALDHFMRVQKKKKQAEMAEKQQIENELLKLIRKRKRAKRTLLVSTDEDVQGGSVAISDHLQHRRSSLSLRPSSSNLSLRHLAAHHDATIAHPLNMYSGASNTAELHHVTSLHDTASAPLTPDHDLDSHTPEDGEHGSGVHKKVILSNPSSPLKPLTAMLDEGNEHSDDDDDFLPAIGTLSPFDMPSGRSPHQLYPSSSPLLRPDEQGSALGSSSSPADSFSLEGNLETFESISADDAVTADVLDLPAPTKKKHKSFLSKFRCWRYLKSLPAFERARHFIIDYLLLVELVLQLASSSLMYALNNPFTGLNPKEGSNYAYKIVVLVFASLFLIVQLVINASISIRLMNKIISSSFSFQAPSITQQDDSSKKEEAPKQSLTASFLTQSYLSTVLVFASIYYFLFAFTPTHEFSRANDFTLDVADVWFTFMYFSVTVMTGTGFGDIYARGLLSRIVAFVQMLISILYACIYIGLGMFVMCEQLDRKAKLDLERQEAKIQKLLSIKAQHEQRSHPNGGAEASPDSPLHQLLHDPQLLMALAEPASVENTTTPFT